MNRLTLNSVPTNAFGYTAENGPSSRAEVVSLGRILMQSYAARGQAAVILAQGRQDEAAVAVLKPNAYKKANEDFQAEHMLYAAKMTCQTTGEAAPETIADFRAQSMRFYGDRTFLRVLSGIYQEVIQPILPAVFSEAVSVFADVYSLGFGETATITVGSNDIPVFQDSSWGAIRSTPRNRFYSKDYTLNPSPKTAQITAKWSQLAGSNLDFGQFFANLAAGMYAKTTGMWSAAMTAAATDTTLIPAGLKYTFNTTNWVTGANKMAALNNTTVGNLFATGGMVPLSKVLPASVTGSTNVNMDAAIATLLGDRYNQSGYLGQYMAVRLLPITDAVVPGTQNGDVTTVLPSDKVWMLASGRRKPMAIAYNAATPMTLEMDPMTSGDMEIGINLTIALDSVSIFSSRVAQFTV